MTHTLRIHMSRFNMPCVVIVMRGLSSVLGTTIRTVAVAPALGRQQHGNVSAGFTHPPVSLVGTELSRMVPSGGAGAAHCIQKQSKKMHALVLNSSNAPFPLVHCQRCTCGTSKLPIKAVLAEHALV